MLYFPYQARAGEPNDVSCVIARIVRAFSKMSRRDEYLALAKEAEEKAEKSKNEGDKASWLRIAAGYHDLVSRQPKTD